MTRKYSWSTWNALRTKGKKKSHSMTIHRRFSSKYFWMSPLRSILAPSQILQTLTFHSIESVFDWQVCDGSWCSCQEDPRIYFLKYSFISKDQKETRIPSSFVLYVWCLKSFWKYRLDGMLSFPFTFNLLLFETQLVSRSLFLSLEWFMQAIPWTSVGQEKKEESGMCVESRISLRNEFVSLVSSRWNY